MLFFLSQLTLGDENKQGMTDPMENRLMLNKDEPTEMQQDLGYLLEIFKKKCNFGE